MRLWQTLAGVVFVINAFIVDWLIQRGSTVASVIDSGGRVRYRGAPDSDYDDPSENAAWLREALDAVLAGQEPSRPETKPVGCSIKWKA